MEKFNKSDKNWRFCKEIQKQIPVKNNIDYDYMYLQKECILYIK